MFFKGVGKVTAACEADSTGDLFNRIRSFPQQIGRYLHAKLVKEGHGGMP